MPKIQVLPDSPASRWSCRLRGWVIGLGLIALAGGGLWYGLELRARNWEGKWTGFVAHWEAKGESFGVEKNLPAAMAAGEDEFAFHPWIRRIAAEDHDVIERLRQMEPEAVAGYAEWQATEVAEDVAAPMPVELAQRLREHAAGFRQELDAFADALRRPGCRLSPAAGKVSAVSAGWVKHLTPLSHLLDGISHAAIAMNDPAAFTETIEISMKAGEKLRASNLMLPVVVGCGFEVAAYQSLRSVPVATVWPRSEPLKWVAALDLRRRSLEDEYIATARVDRGLFLDSIGELENAGASGISGLSPLRRVFLARAKLAPCEAMQGLFAVPFDWKSVARFESYGAAKHHKSDPALNLGFLMLVLPRRSIYDSLLRLEGERTAIRKALGETP